MTVFVVVFLKANPISVKGGGSVISIKDAQSWKAAPISVKVGGSVISAKDLQLWKADPPILVKAGGSVISAKDLHSRKARKMISAVPSGTVTGTLLRAAARHGVVEGSLSLLAQCYPCC